MKKVILNNNGPIKNILEAMRTNNEFLLREMGESFKQKNLWVAQIITIGSAILGGFLLTQKSENLIIKIGISLLFLVIFIGLMLIYKSNKESVKSLIEAYGKSNDYYIRYMIYLDLSNKENLTEKEQKTKTEIETYLSASLHEIGVINEEGGLGSVYEKLLSGRKTDWANYALIIGFFLSGLILTFSNYITCWLGLEK
jgi:hypothetical protein